MTVTGKFEQIAADSRGPLDELVSAIAKRDAPRVADLLRTYPETVNALIPGPDRCRPIHRAAEVCAAQGMKPEEHSARVMGALLASFANPIAENAQGQRASDIVGRAHDLYHLLRHFESEYLNYGLSVMMNMRPFLPVTPFAISKKPR